MASNESQPRRDDERRGSALQGSRTQDSSTPDSMAQSQSRRNEESWVEVASQPSSSSLSSIGDEIVTTGLRVGGRVPPLGRRCHPQQHGAIQVRQTSTVIQSVGQMGTSSQEEYEETESEEDGLMTSSAENVRPPPPGLPRQQRVAGTAIESGSDDDEEDDNGTALGRPSTSPTFRPQPNLFSHPPHHLQHRSHSATSSRPHHHPYPRPSMSQRSQTRVHRGGPSFMSPSSREDNEEALRASLTTLLSCAAAARGLPKKGEAVAGPSGLDGGVRPGTQPVDLRLVPESELMAETPATGTHTLPRKAPPRTASNSSAPSGPASTSSRDATEKTKRAASTSQAKTPRATKKKRTSPVVDGDTAALLSPTLLTWVVSAGVVVLVSVVGFGAGFVYGREVGRLEGLGTGLDGGASNASSATACGREIVRSTASGGSLRRFRWGTSMVRSAAA